MYRLLGLLTGIILAIMVTINGGLSENLGLYTSTTVIHAVGVIFALIVILITRKKLYFGKNLPIWVYTGGVIGIMNVVFCSFAYGKISMTSIVALGLFGQTFTALIMDCFGLLGLKKTRFRASSLIGLVFSLAGIILMLDKSQGAAIYAILFSIASGVTVVVSRTINAELARHIGDLHSSFVNHLAGLFPTIALLLIFGRAEFQSVEFGAWWSFIGGAIGVIVVIICNITVQKVPAFQLTMLTFVGQVFTGIAIDMILKKGYSTQTFWAGIIISAGIVINLLWDWVAAKKTPAVLEVQ